MAKNLQQHGNTLPVTAPSGGVVSGDFFLIASTLCVALADAAVGDDVEASIEGVYKNAPADDTTAFDDLAPLYWDGLELVNVPDDGEGGLYPFVGLCIGGKALAADSCSIKLVPSE